MTSHEDGPDPLDLLRDAGFDLSLFDDDQLELLTSLSADEVSVLLDIKERIGDIHPEVEPHAPMTIGGLLF